jgi:hypothetical protein
MNKSHLKTSILTEEVEHDTPAGGVRSRVYYMDDNNRPADKKVATRVRILEYDKDGELIQTTYGTLGKSKATDDK